MSGKLPAPFSKSGRDGVGLGNLSGSGYNSEKCNVKVDGGGKMSAEEERELEEWIAERKRKWPSTKVVAAKLNLQVDNEESIPERTRKSSDQTHENHETSAKKNKSLSVIQDAYGSMTDSSSRSEDLPEEIQGKRGLTPVLNDEDDFERPKSRAKSHQNTRKRRNTFTQSSEKKTAPQANSNVRHIKPNSGQQRGSNLLRKIQSKDIREQHRLILRGLHHLMMHYDSETVHK